MAKGGVIMGLGPKAAQEGGMREQVARGLAAYGGKRAKRAAGGRRTKRAAGGRRPA